MADARDLVVGLLCGGLALSCAAQARSPAAAPPAPAPTAPSFSNETGALARYHSKRLALSLPLPEGRAWSIDDHSAPELVATHAATHSKIVVAILRADALMGRNQCEELARAGHLLPEGALQTLDEEVAVTQENYDTLIRVALQPGNDPKKPLVGHVTATGGFLRKCFVFAFSSEVDSAADAPVLSSRLAFARTRILGGLELDPFSSVGRAAVPGGPILPRGP